MPVTLPVEMFAGLKLVATRVVKAPTVAKRDVEVEFVVVELSPVKFWRVDDPDTRRLAREERPVEVMVPRYPLFAEKFEAKRDVDVEFEVVLRRAVKFWSVDDANDRNPPFRYDKPETVIAVDDA